MLDDHPPTQSPTWKRVLYLVSFVIIGLGGAFIAVVGGFGAFLATGGDLDDPAPGPNWGGVITMIVLTVMVVSGTAFGLVKCWRGFRRKGALSH